MFDTQTAPPDPFEERLRRVVAKLPEAPRMIGCARLSGGASQETWRIDTEGSGAPRRLILRRSPGGADHRREAAAGLDNEAKIIAWARTAGVPVPQILAVLTAQDGLGSGFLSEYIPGETIPRRLLRDARFDGIRPQLAGQCGGILARIHSLRPPSEATLQRLPAPDGLAKLERQYRRQRQPRPVFEWAFRWLHDRLPPAAGDLCLVHGDFRNGNLMIDEQGVVAVLDWELTHFGDPLEDLGWFCVPSWRFGELDRPAGGFGSIEALVAGYQSAGGAPVDPGRLFYWMVFGTLFWGVTCTEFALEFRRGDRAIERAVIGRRASETELDLLWLLDSKAGL
jgi:aminoglycoside phosphotransferase (APT) family kinase protein